MLKKASGRVLVKVDSAPPPSSPATPEPSRSEPVGGRPPGNSLCSGALQAEWVPGKECAPCAHLLGLAGWVWGLGSGCIRVRGRGWGWRGSSLFPSVEP